MMINTFNITTTSEQAITASDILKQRLIKRDMNIETDGYIINLIIDKTLKTDEFIIADYKDGIEISSGALLGLIHGVGFFLRDSDFSSNNVIISKWRGNQTPKCTIRGVYFAAHFHNYFHVSSVDEMREYIEDLALWGFNYIKLTFAMLDIKSETDPLRAIDLERINKIFIEVHKLGMKTAIGSNLTSGYGDFPREYSITPHADPTHRRGNSGNMMCPAIPESNKLIKGYLENWVKELQPSGIDLFMLWPYDEGGCACEKCYPWGANGFIRHGKEHLEIVRKYFPDVDRCVSTWVFDTPYEGEWEALSKSIEQEDWFDTVLADSHEDFPKYPLENGVPGNRPMINFPEISMWGLWPWGGWGATALPQRFTRLWGQAGDVLSGGFIYSEGIYEDINKAVISQLYWYGSASFKDTLKQYAQYELGIKDTAKFIEMISLLEKSHSDVAENGICDIFTAEKTYELARQLDDDMPSWSKQCWRWRIIYLRTLLDIRRYKIAQKISPDGPWLKLKWIKILKDDDIIQEAFREIIEIFQCEKKYSGDQYHIRVRPTCE